MSDREPTQNTDTPERQDGRPNIVVFLMDELRRDCLGYAGNPDVQTPHLDQLAKRGVGFSEAICQFPISVPSRASLWTGQYASTHRVDGSHVGLPSTAITLPRALRAAGYRTACVGHMDFVPPYRSHGFEIMRLAEQSGAGRMVDDYHRYLAGKGLTDQIDLWDQVDRSSAPPEYWESFGAMVSNLSEEDHSTTWIGRETIAAMERLEKEPFFVVSSYIKPHHPFDPPSPWDEMYDPSALTLPRDYCQPIPEGDINQRTSTHFDLETLNEETFRRILAYYYAVISHIDMQIGRTVDWLEANGLLENTIIVVASDHGDFMGQHGLVLKSDGRLYDSLIGVPLLISGVTGQMEDATSHALAELVDVMPTLLDAAGVNIPRRIQGRSLVSVLRGDRADEDHRTAAYCDCNGVEAIRDRHWKLIWGRRLDDPCLFNLEHDPEEMENLYHDPAFEGRRREMMDTLVRLLVTHQEHAKTWTRDATFGNNYEVCPRS